MDTDFWYGIEKLEPNGTNWNRFQRMFLIAVRHEQLYGHFDGSSKMPTAVKTGSADTTTTTRATAGARDINAAIKAWEKKENSALYLLMQKLPDSIFVRYMRKETVAEMWAAIVQDFTHQLIMMTPHLHSEFMAMRYEKGANLRSEFDRVRMKYGALLNAGVEISNNDYCSLIIKFVPLGIANFISRLVSTFKLCRRLSLESATATSSSGSPGSSNELRKELFIDPEILMEIASDEWERRDAYRKSRNPSSNTNAGTTSRGNLDSNASSGRSRGRRRGGQQGDCWNCGGRGHYQDVCPSPKIEEEDKRPSTQGPRNNAPGTKSNTKPTQSNPS